MDGQAKREAALIMGQRKPSSKQHSQSLWPRKTRGALESVLSGALACGG
jgi:hypothetical protein